jgi:integrase/recombinase XerD
MNNKHSLPVLRQTALSRSQRVVSYLTPEEVQRLADIASRERQGERNSLLIILLFQTGLRISEALSITPANIQRLDGQPVLSVIGKGRKIRTVSIPGRLADRLKGYAYEKQLDATERFFNINRSRAWQIIRAVSLKAGLNKRVYPHLFRHSDAIERLRQTGNPKALQLHLGHASSMMTMRYLNTLSEQDAIKIQGSVQFDF